jgi:hypothetical protein
MRAQHWLFFALAGMAVAAVAGLMPLLTAPPASAQPIAGAHYSGSVTDAGDISFDVSAAGDQVLNLKVTQIPCDAGTQDQFPWPSSPPWPSSALIMIVDDHFEGTLPPTATKVTGDFLTDGSATGTFLLDLGDCRSPELAWTASASAAPTTTASPSPTLTATTIPSPTETATPPVTPTATPTPKPTPTASPTPGGLVAGWNHVCYIGPSQNIQDALANISQDVLAAYRLGAEGYNKWFPDKPDISTITTLSPYKPLFLLLASNAAWPQQPSGPPPAATPLVQGWNSVCYTGETKDVESATQGISGQFAVLYVLAPNGSWQRFVPGRPDVSDPVQIGRFTSVLILVTEAGGTQWPFDP